MKKRIPMIIGLVWLLMATALYGYGVWNGQPDGIYTYDNDGCTINQKVYVSDNENAKGLIYEMDLYGNVTDFFSTSELQEQAQIHEVTTDGEKLYAVMEVLKSVSEGSQREYVILEFENGLQIARMTPVISLYENDRLTDLSVDENACYLSTVTTDGEAASVYEVSLQQLTDPETAAKTGLELESSLRREAVPGRIFVEAAYEMGGLSVRTDADLVSGPFALDDSIRYTYSLCHMSFGQLMSLHGSYRVYWLFAVAAGWLVIFLLQLLFKNHNRVVYTVMVVELVLFMVILGGLGVLVSRQVQTENKAKTKWLSAVLNGVLNDVGDLSQIPFSEDYFYTSDSYAGLLGYLNMAYTQTAEDGCVDLFFADASELTIRVSTSGRNYETVDARYFKLGSEVAASLICPGSITNEFFTLDGTDYQIYAAAKKDVTGNDYVLFGVYLDDSLAIENWQTELVAAFLIFALASLFCILILTGQSADLGRLAHSMQLVAKGKTDVKRPRIYGGDMRILWNALGEIQKKIRSVNYAKFLTFEAYYRFAPKNIERLLNKESITEVTSGDVIRLKGTMAMISTVGARDGSEQEIDRLNRLIAMVGRYQEEKDGVFVSGDGALSILRLLYMEHNTNTLNSSVDFLKEFSEQEAAQSGSVPRTTILLHYSSFVYGVAGTNQQSSAFLVSPDTDEIEHFAAWFRERGLRLVISEDVKKRENYEGALRCIGYIQMESSGKKINMYEVLDAYDVRERDCRLAVCDRFAQALELFYQHDFYLARSAFSDILKELPTDEISKWYLFTCETYLNMEHAEDVPCALRYKE